MCEASTALKLDHRDTSALVVRIQMLVRYWYHYGESRRELRMSMTCTYFEKYKFDVDGVSNKRKTCRQLMMLMTYHAYSKTTNVTLTKWSDAPCQGCGRMRSSCSPSRATPPPYRSECCQPPLLAPPPPAPPAPAIEKYNSDGCLECSKTSGTEPRQSTARRADMAGFTLEALAEWQIKWRMSPSAPATACW